MAEQNSVFKTWANREKEATQQTEKKAQPLAIPVRTQTLNKSGESLTTTTNPLRKSNTPPPSGPIPSPSKNETSATVLQPTQSNEKLSNDNLASEIEELKEQIESLQTKLKEQKSRNEKLVLERTSTISLVESLQTALNQTKDSFSKQTQLLEQERQKSAKKKNKIRQLKDQIQQMTDSRDDAYAKIGEENFLLQNANAKIEQLTEILRDRVSTPEPKQEVEEQRILEPAAAREHVVIQADSPPVSPTESRKFDAAKSPSRSVSPPSDARLSRARTENNRSFRQLQATTITEAEKSKVEKTLTMRNIFRRKNTTDLPPYPISPTISPSTSPPNISPIEENSEKFSIPVQSNSLTLNTMLERTVTVKEVIDQLRKKFPGNTENYKLFVKTGKGSKSSTIKLEENRILASYKQVLDGKSKLIFTEDGKKKKKSKKEKSENALLSHLKDNERKILEELYQAIKHEESEKVEFILQGSTVDIPECPLDGDGLTILHVAVKSKNVAIVEHFIEYYDRKQRSVNTKDKFGWTILHHSAFNCHGQPSEEEILRKLLDIPTLAVDIPNDDKNLPLHYFAQKYTNLSCYEIGKSLIKKSPSTVNHKNKNGETPLHKAIFNPVVRMIMVNLLIEHGADVNTQNLTHGETVLHYAVRLGRRDLVKILMYHGADITLKDTTSGQTPLELAISSGQTDIADILKIAFDLFKWLQEFQLEELFVPLVKDDITVEHLSATKEEDLNSILDRLGIHNAFGTRIRFKQAWNMLQKINGHVESSFFRRKSVAMATDVNLSSGVIEHHQLEFTKEIGSGAGGQVYRGLFKGVKVAIKVLKNEDKVKRELEIINAVQSNHIIKCFGVCMKPNVCVVMEYACKGSLYQVLHRDMTIDWEKGLKWSEDIALGLKCLHTWNPVIVHRDIKSGNMLVNHDWDVKIGDLGLARFDTEQNHAAMQKVCGTYAYLAPEIYSGKRYTEKSDVFSFGIVFWEIVMRVLKGKYQTPYFDEYPNIVNEIQIPIQVAENHLRPTLPQDCPQSVASLVQSCLEAIPDKRPSAIEILEQLESIRRELNVN